MPLAPSAVRPAQLAITGETRWYFPFNYLSGTTAGVADGQVGTAPFNFDKTITIDRAFAEVTSAGAALSVLRFAVVRPVSSGLPGGGVVLGELGTVAADSTGAKILTPGTPLVVTPGPFFVVAAAQGGAPTLRGYRGLPSLPWFSASSNNPGTSVDVGIGSGWYTAAAAVAGAFGATLPATPSASYTTAVLLGLRVT